MSASRPAPGLGTRFRLLWRRLRGGALSRTRATASVAVGLFIGSLPLYGLHFPLCFAICVPLRLDLFSAYLAANVSNPLIAPFLIAAEIEVGSLLLTGRFVPFDVERAKSTGISGFVAQAAVGSLLVGALLAALGALITWLIATRRMQSRGQRSESARASQQTELRTAIRRTTERYASARHADRMYVASKLRTDPLIAQLAELDLRLGRVIDAGCGRGQIGLLLLELGAASSLVGWDWDDQKIRVARVAAGSTARFECSDLLNHEWPEADSVLLIDVLHYLDRPRQAALLERAAGSLAPGGRIMLRELDKSAGFSAWLGMLFERIAVKLSYNRGAMLEFRSAAEIVAELNALGLRVKPDGAWEGAPLGNRLMIAERPAST